MINSFVFAQCPPPLNLKWSLTMQSLPPSYIVIVYISDAARLYHIALRDYIEQFQTCGSYDVLVPTLDHLITVVAYDCRHNISAQ